MHHRPNGHSSVAVLVHRFARIIGPFMRCRVWNDFGRHEEIQLIAGLRIRVEDLLEPSDDIELGFRLLQLVPLVVAQSRYPAVGLVGLAKPGHRLCELGGGGSPSRRVEDPQGNELLLNFDFPQIAGERRAYFRRLLLGPRRSSGEKGNDGCKPEETQCRFQHDETPLKLEIRK